MPLFRSTISDASLDNARLIPVESIMRLLRLKCIVSPRCESRRIYHAGLSGSSCRAIE